MSKTTLAGVFTILGGITAFVLAGLKSGNFADPGIWTILLAAIATGIGLIKAEDATP